MERILQFQNGLLETIQNGLQQLCVCAHVCVCMVCVATHMHAPADM